MIVACPGCSARYQIETDRLRSDGVRLRCTRCEAVFRVSPPAPTAQAPAAAPAESVQPAPSPQPAASSAAASVPTPPTSVQPASGEPAPSLAPPMSRPAPPAAPSPPIDRERMILVADPEVEQGKSTASALAQWGLQPTLVHDGVEAIMAIQRLLPRAIVLDAALPKMFGFQVCEIVKRNESLRDIHVVLVGAIHDRTRYRRPPEEIYGADAYIERQQLPDSLRPLLEGFGMLPSSAPKTEAPAAAAPITPAVGATELPAAAPIAPPVGSAAPAMPPAVPAPAVPEPAAAPAGPATAPIEPPQSPVAAPELVPAPAPATAEPGSAEKIEQAERLARIVVSDIVLYSKEKFEAAVAAGNVLEAMRSEIAEGRTLFTARVDPEIQKLRDFLSEEMLRVAAARSQK
jgi:predicted Zn finger-like uncharacterized protein